MTAATDIFLSYNREDQAAAQRFAEAFKREGLSVWWDVTLRSGETYDEVTEAALRGAKAVVVLWSPRSVQSHWVRAEATIAHRAKTLIPAVIAPCDKPVMFELTQTAELAHWQGETEDKVWRSFLGDVRRMVGRQDPPPPAHDPPPANAHMDEVAGPPFVAMLPLTYRPGDDALAALAEDLTEDITREMAQGSLFRMISASTMARWRGKDADHMTLRRDLHANYAIEGRCQRAGEDIRLSFQLVDTATGGMLKSARYVRPLGDISARPDELPPAVATELGEDIEQVEMNRAITQAGPLSGWDHLLRAMAHTRRAGAESNARAIEEGRRAVAAAPDIGLAHAVLAHTLSIPAGGFGEEPDEDRTREIQAHARRAMQLDGDNPEVFAQLMTCYAAIGETDAGMQLARRAFELSPKSPTSLFWLAVSYAGTGRTTEAIATIATYESLTRLHRHRPVAIWIRGMCEFLEGRYAEAANSFDRSLAIHPDFTNSLKWKAIVVSHLGDETAALAIIRRIKELEPGISLEQHIWQMIRITKMGELCADAAATFRRLWEATEQAP
jgi:TolB-like protein/Tfp pilus assembly protein PilF